MPRRYCANNVPTANAGSTVWRHRADRTRCTRHRGPRRRKACRAGATDDDRGRGPLGPRGGRVVRQWLPYGAGGQPATPTCARPAGRQRPISARCIDRLSAVRSAIRAASLSASRPRRSRPAQRSDSGGRRYVHVLCGHRHRAGRGGGAEPAMLSRQAVAWRGRRTPTCRGGLCIRRWVRPASIYWLPQKHHGRHARCTTPSARVPQDEVLELGSDRMCHGIAMCGPR